jgi:hypothetical protein
MEVRKLASVSGYLFGAAGLCVVSCLPLPKYMEEEIDRNEVCAEVNEGRPHIACLGEWRYNEQRGVCRFECYIFDEEGNRLN